MPSVERACAGQRQDILAVERHAAGVRAIEAGDHVEQAGLAGAVRPDDRRDAALSRPRPTRRTAPRSRRRRARRSRSSAGPASGHPIPAAHAQSRPEGAKHSFGCRKDRFARADMMRRGRAACGVGRHMACGRGRQLRIHLLLEQRRRETPRTPAPSSIGGGSSGRPRRRRSRTPPSSRGASGNRRFSRPAARSSRIDQSGISAMPTPASVAASSAWPLSVWNVPVTGTSITSPSGSLKRQVVRPRLSR